MLLVTVIGTTAYVVGTVLRVNETCGYGVAFCFFERNPYARIKDQYAQNQRRTASELRR